MVQSETRFPDRYRFQPQRIALPSTCHLEIGHRGFLIGIVHTFILRFDEMRVQIPTKFGVELPKEVEGDYVVGQATLFDSPLAERAWDALRLGIFLHVCPLVFRKIDEPAGMGQLVEISLVDGAYTGCQNARVRKTWKA